VKGLHEFIRITLLKSNTAKLYLLVMCVNSSSVLYNNVILQNHTYIYYKPTQLSHYWCTFPNQTLPAVWSFGVSYADIAIKSTTARLRLLVVFRRCATTNFESNALIGWPWYSFRHVRKKKHCMKTEAAWVVFCQHSLRPNHL